MKVLVTGATGYIGRRLVPHLLEIGHDVRVLVRDRKRIVGCIWEKDVEISVGDLLETESIVPAMESVEAAYYLVHSMSSGADFAERDRTAAFNFVSASKKADRLKHVVYLGGLLPDEKGVSEHLGSRGEVGEILREALPTTEFRAGPVIGSGSASFEMVRYLTERLPVMVAPKWIFNQVQPIAVGDVLNYLALALEKQSLGVVEIGSDRLTFKRMLEVYAEVRGLRRYILSVPVLTPKLAALWVGLVTPISNTLAVPIVKGIVQPVIADIEKAREEFPEINPIPYRRAVELALKHIQEGGVKTRWTVALGDANSYELSEREGLITETRMVNVNSSPELVFETFSSLGGERGWLVWERAWKLRGFVDQIAGGPGLRPGRRDPLELLPGEALDFWRVEEVDPPNLLRLRAEMKVPGRAWLQWEAVPNGSATRLIQTAMFAPKGLWGAIYWYSLYPLHKAIFSGMVKAIAKLADGKQGQSSSE